MSSLSLFLQADPRISIETSYPRLSYNNHPLYSWGFHESVPLTSGQPLGLYPASLAAILSAPWKQEPEETADDFDLYRQITQNFT